MTNVPLIQSNSAQEINTSIIAIKKAQKELELLNRQIDEKIKALNFALIGGDGKYIQSIEQSAGLIKAIEGNISDSVADGDNNPITSGGVYTALQEYNPVDTIAYNNMKAVTSNAVANILCYSTSGRTLTGPALQSGIIIRVMFTAQQTGSNTTTAFTITYNGTAYTVKAPKNGSLANFVASNVSGSYIYCQAYTTLELLFDGTQFVIIGNPVVISNSDYTIYTDGSQTIKNAQRNLGISTVEVHSGGSNAYYKIGYVSNSNAQAFTVLEIIGGRVDSQRGIRYLSLSNRTTCNGKAIFPSNNNGIYVYNIDSKLYVYASLETYVYLQFLSLGNTEQRFTFEVEKVSSLPSNPIFNNNFTEM